MDRSQLLEMAHRNSAPDIDICRFAMIFGEWDFVPLYNVAEIIGVMMVNQNEIHVAIDAQFQRMVPFRRVVVADAMQKILDEYGCVVTVVQNTDEQSKRFVERVGFVPEQAGDLVTQYKLTEIKLKKRGTTCQQLQP